MEFNPNPLGNRFRGYLPVVIDIETAGFNAKKNPLLEIAAVIVEPDSAGNLVITESHFSHIVPFKNSELDQAALKFNGIDPYHPFRFALDEKDALHKLFTPIKAAVKRNKCTRAILVGHNPAFDIGFLNAAIARADIKKSPFHPFSSFDTATLGGLVYGQTVLAKVAQAAGLNWDNEKAHSALYDAEQTAHLFCLMVNRWKRLESLEQHHANNSPTL
jgi:ribonuclease T